MASSAVPRHMHAIVVNQELDLLCTKATLRARKLYCSPTLSSMRPMRMHATRSNLGTAAGATSKASSRKSITPISDDGRYRWNELSAGEKVARGTQQSFNFFVVCLGAVMTASRPGEGSRPT